MFALMQLWFRFGSGASHLDLDQDQVRGLGLNQVVDAPQQKHASN